MLAIAYNHGKVNLSVVYETADGTLPKLSGDFTQENLKTAYGADLVVFYSPDDYQGRKGLNIPVPHLSGKALEHLICLASVRNRLVHKRRNKALDVTFSMDEGKTKSKKSRKKQKINPDSGGRIRDNNRIVNESKEGAKPSPSVSEAKKRQRPFYPYEKLYDFQKLVSVARVFSTFCNETRISDILSFEDAPKAKVRAICRYAERLGFRKEADNTLLRLFEDRSRGSSDV